VVEVEVCDNGGGVTERGGSERSRYGGVSLRVSYILKL